MKARSRAAVPTAMRLVLPALLAATCAAETQPLFDLTLVDGPALRPDGAAGALWDETLGLARTWIAARVGAVPMPPRLALAYHARSGPDLLPLPALGATWGPVPAEVLPRIGEGLGRWKHTTVTTEDGIISASLQGAPAPDLPSAGAPALTVTIHLDQVLESLRIAAADEIPDRIEIDEACALLGRLQPRWGLSAGARGWCESGLPARWFRPLRADDLRGVAAEATWCLALSIDGAALATDAADLPPTLAAGFALGSAALGLALDPARAAAACEGTWVICGVGLDVLVAAPRHPTIDAAVTALLAQGRLTPPAEGGDALALDGGALLQRTPTRWLLASGPALMQRWIAAEAVPAVFADSEGAHGIYGRILPAGGALLNEIAEELAWTLPLDIRHPRLRALGADLGQPLAEDRAVSHLRAACASGQGLRGRITDPDQRWRWDLDGGILPWYLPAATLWWAVAPAVGEENRLALIDRVEALRAQGQAVLPADLLPTAPAPAAIPTDLAARCQGLKDATDGDAAAAEWRRFLERGYLPAQAVPGDLAPYRALVAESAWVDALAGIDLAPEYLRQEAAAGRSGMARRLPHIDGVRALTGAGRALVALGDAEGLVLLRRARILEPRPLSILELLVRIRTRQQTDAAMLAAVASSNVEPAAMEAWLAEPPLSEEIPAAIDAEAALYLGTAIAGIIDGDTFPPAGEARLLMPQVWTMPTVTAFTATDCAEVLAYHRAWSRRDEAAMAAAIAAMRSPLAPVVLPSLSHVTLTIDQAGLHHGMVRLAARLLRAGVPADAAAAAAAVGDLSVILARQALPLTYRREGELFTLSLPEQRPEGIPEQTWRRLTQRQRTDNRLVLDRQDVIQIGPIRRLEAMDANADF